MRSWSRRGIFKIFGIGAALAGSAGKAEAGLFFLKKLLGRPPRETKPITPNREFYVYHYADSAYRMIKDLDVRQWSLRITGNVRNPITLTYGDILNRPSSSVTSTIECIENPVGGDSIGTAVWRGIPLGPLLNEAGIPPENRDVVFKAADGYSDSIPVSKSLMVGVLLAYEMNGQTLPSPHGFPLRVVVPGIYGMKNVKWLTEIEAVDYDFKGYWQQRGWSDTARVRISSRIDFPGHYQEVQPGRHTVRGSAYSGDKGISSVEVSTDGGKSWNPARLAVPLSPYAWVLWEFDWEPAREDLYHVTVRAFDGGGLPQDAADTRPFPDGPTGLDTVIVHVVERKG